MEFKIKKHKEKRLREPHYKLTICFMEGPDRPYTIQYAGDGYQKEEVIFKLDEIENLKKLVLAVECCNAAYSNGKGGYDEYDGLEAYDAFFLEDGVDLDFYDSFLNDQEIDPSNEKEAREAVRKYLIEKWNPSGIYIKHPSDSGYISTSFDGYSLEFIDTNGDSSEVIVTLSKEEQALVKQAEEIFK